jgi:glutamate decarboxylase
MCVWSALSFIISTQRKFVDGLTYAGVGWAIWRNKSFLPDEILFTVNYLGSPQVSFTLNFSKSGVHVIGQYYQFLRLGKTGYRNIVRFT